VAAPVPSAARAAVVGLGMTAVGAVAIPALLNEIWNGKGGLLEGLNKQAASNNNSAKSLIATGDVEAMQRTTPAAPARRSQPLAARPLRPQRVGGQDAHEDMIAALEAAIAAQVFKDNSYDAAEKIKGAANDAGGRADARRPKAANKSYRLLVADRARSRRPAARPTACRSSVPARQPTRSTPRTTSPTASPTPTPRSTAARPTPRGRSRSSRPSSAGSTPRPGTTTPELASDILLVKGAINALKTSSAHKSDEVKVQTTKAGQAVALAVRKKNLSVNLTTVTNVKVDGRNVASANYHYYGRDHQVPN
jgi:hypothetical protein